MKQVRSPEPHWVHGKPASNQGLTSGLSHQSQAWETLKVTSPPAGGRASANTCFPAALPARRVPTVTSPRWLIHSLCQQKVSPWETCQRGIKNDACTPGERGRRTPPNYKPEGEPACKTELLSQGCGVGKPHETTWQGLAHNTSEEKAARRTARTGRWAVLNVCVSLSSKVKSQAGDGYFILCWSHSSVLNSGDGWRSLRKTNKGVASWPIDSGLFASV